MRILRPLSCFGLPLLGIGLLLVAGLSGTAAAQSAAAIDACEPDPQCREVCVQKARAAYTECKAAGGSQKRCRRVRRTLREACVTSECGPMLRCEDRCAALAQRIVQRCIEGGGDVLRCRMDGRNAEASCIEKNCQGCACPRIYDPVCGTDGVTYGNACEADCAGVDIDRTGACEPRCRSGACDVSCPYGYVRDADGCPTCECKPAPMCTDDTDCGDKSICRLICPATPSRPCIQGQECPPCVGMCVPKPDPCLCTAQYDPVCGTDGTTYANSCKARCAGVPVAHEGRCRDDCRDNSDCSAIGEICFPRTNTCQPECAIQCLRYDPVCGEDGNTYGCGAADAHCHGVEVKHPGACIGCPQIYDPVCGDDGRTYSNSCLARLSGVTVAHDGACVSQCPLVVCNLFCELGFETGADGCPQCLCRTTPSSDPPRPVPGVVLQPAGP